MTGGESRSTHREGELRMTPGSGQGATRTVTRRGCGRRCPWPHREGPAASAGDALAQSWTLGGGRRAARPSRSTMAWRAAARRLRVWTCERGPLFVLALLSEPGTLCLIETPEATFILARPGPFRSRVAGFEVLESGDGFPRPLPSFPRSLSPTPIGERESIPVNQSRSSESEAVKPTFEEPCSPVPRLAECLRPGGARLRGSGSEPGCALNHVIGAPHRRETGERRTGSRA